MLYMKRFNWAIFFPLFRISILDVYYDSLNMCLYYYGTLGVLMTAIGCFLTLLFGRGRLARRSYGLAKSDVDLDELTGCAPDL